MNAPAFASLPMYELPQLAPAWDRFWRLARAELAARGIEAAEALRRDSPYAGVWRDPDLLVGQTCGWPLVSQLDDTVVPFARFDFGLDAAGGGHYHSVFIRSRKFAGEILQRPLQLEALIRAETTRIAINSPDSQSGFRVFGECMPAPITVCRDRIVVTGSHIGSIRAVATEEVDLAAIDAATWQFALDHEPAARAAGIVARSADVPGLPLITSARRAGKVPVLLECLALAAKELEIADRAALHLRGIVPARREDYEVLKRPPFGQFRIA